MSTNTIDAELLSRMFLAGARKLESRKEWINELNVFPVPDGDTGTNMSLTIESASKEVLALDVLLTATTSRINICYPKLRCLTGLTVRKIKHRRCHRLSGILVPMQRWYSNH